MNENSGGEYSTNARTVSTEYSAKTRTIDGPAIPEKSFKRHVAFKHRIGTVMSGKTTLTPENKLQFVEINGGEVMRVNIIANVVDKFVQDGEKKFGSITLDDATGQIKAKLFGDDVEQFEQLQQGDTVLVIGMLRYWNNEVYITPEIIKKKDSAFLVVRKLEAEAAQPKLLDKETIAALKDTILSMVKNAEANGGVEIEKIIMELKEPPAVINSEIKKLLEDGVAYEPRPGKLRYLG